MARAGNRTVEEVEKWTPKLHVWAAIGYHTKCKLYFFQQNMTASLYQKIIKARLKEKQIEYSSNCPRTLREKWVFLQDNDPKHKARGSLSLLQELCGTRQIAHPPNSPDLNPVENIWSYLDRKVKSKEN
jgi:hypothetical protein